MNRICRELGTKRQIVVLNDEAHHCYRRRVDVETDESGLSPEERREARIREEEARRMGHRTDLGTGEASESRSRPLCDTVLPPVGLPGGHSLPVGGVGFPSLIDATSSLASSRFLRADRRQRDDRHNRHLPRPLAEDPGGTTATCGDDAKPLTRLSRPKQTSRTDRDGTTATRGTRALHASYGHYEAVFNADASDEARLLAGRRRFTSWFATTPRPRSSSLTTLRAGRKPRRLRSRARSHSSRTSPTAASSCGRTRSSLTRHSSNPARACRMSSAASLRRR